MSKTATATEEMTVKDKLYTNRFKPDDRSHLIIKDHDICLTECEEKWCTRFCPAEVYEWGEDVQKILVGYEGCVECGTCRIGCPYINIEWLNPRGGFGVVWRFG